MAAPMTPPPGAPEFLARAGWDGARIEPLAGDASFRRYFRVFSDDRRAVLMDAPPRYEDARPFLAIARHLKNIGFATPAILAEDTSQGLILLEDFGDNRMREHVDAAPAVEHGVYSDTVGLLADLHRFPAAALPAYSQAELQREAGLFVEWYCPAVGLDVDAKAYARAWDQPFAAIVAAPPVTVLRDYHSENIMLRDGLEGRARLGLLDFQDALAGHTAYDLVSLLQDARRDVSPALEAAMIAHYQTLAPPDDSFEVAYAILGAQRNAKILGIFTRLWKRDGKPRYLEYLPRVWTYLERDLNHPALVDVRRWFDINLPTTARAGYWV